MTGSAKTQHNRAFILNIYNLLSQMYALETFQPITLGVTALQTTK